MLDHIEFLISEALVSLKRNGWMTFSAISTAAIALFLIGGMGYAYFRLRNYTGELSERFTMRAFLRDGASPSEIHECATRIRQFEGVAQVQWVPKEKAWERWRAEYPDVTAGLQNPFPDALKIRLSDLDKTSEVVAKIKALPMIATDTGVEYLEPEQRFLSESLWLIRWLGIALGGLGLLTAGILIYNAIRLTILSRRREIRIMQLVGATHATVRVPFLIEGAIHGAAGGALAALLIKFAHWGVSRALLEFSTLGRPGEFPLGAALVVLTLVGIAYGVGCSALAVRSPLRIGRGAA